MIQQEPIVPLRCGDITAANVLAQANSEPLYRPGVKAILFDPTPPTPHVLLGMLPEGYPYRFNFPGGGIDEGEDLATALLREMIEEFGHFGLKIEQVRQSRVVASGKLPFPRDGYKGKYEYLVAVPFVGLQTLVPLADSKIVLFPPMLWNVAAKQVWEDTRVHLDQRVLYSRGIREVPRAALLAA